jgi:hypothetical protein
VLDYEQNNIELAATAVAMSAKGVPSTSTGLAMPPLSCAFKAVGDAKTVQIDTDDLAKTVQFGANLNPK